MLFFVKRLHDFSFGGEVAGENRSLVKTVVGKKKFFFVKKKVFFFKRKYLAIFFGIFLC